MKIVVIGTRGIPEIQGGVETHCQELYPRIAAMGHDVTVIRRTPYVTPDNRPDHYQGVKLIDLYAPHKKSLEAIVHTLLALIKARSMNPDVVHIHAIGPALMTPLAKLLGLKVVTTNHGPDYDRQKWGTMAKKTLMAGEHMGAKYADSVIVISTVIANILATKYGRRDTILIPNGVTTPPPVESDKYLKQWGLEKGRYVVAIGRFVEEKGFHDLIKAWRESSLPSRGIKLAIGGDADHPDEYSRHLKAMAAEAGVVTPGFIRGEALNELMSGAALYVMPSYHEGLPIALLEAMSHNLDVVVSDIPANKLPELEETDFFPVGNTEALTKMLEERLGTPATPRCYDLSRYNWDNIARETARVYENLVNAR